MLKINNFFHHQHLNSCLKRRFSVTQKTEPNESPKQTRKEKIEKELKEERLFKNAKKVMSGIDLHVKSAEFRSKFNLIHYCQTYAWCCLHFWLISNRLRLQHIKWLQIPKAWLFKKQFNYLVNAKNYKESYEFDDKLDRNVYLELKRIKQTLEWSLDDFFIYNFTAKPIDQICHEDLNLIQAQQEKDVQQMKKCVQYINSTMDDLKGEDFNVILEGNYEWKI